MDLEEVEEEEGVERMRWWVRLKRVWWKRSRESDDVEKRETAVEGEFLSKQREERGRRGRRDRKGRKQGQNREEKIYI